MTSTYRVEASNNDTGGLVVCDVYRLGTYSAADDGFQRKEKVDFCNPKLKCAIICVWSVGDQILASHALTVHSGIVPLNR